MKKIISIFLILFTLTGLCSCKEETLPTPETEEGVRGELGIDKNINESTIDNYLNREDSVYRDMRMLIDEADYEAVGGDSYLSGIVEGFEVVSFPYICNVEGLPEEVGSTYTGVTLFTHEDGEYIANYAESMDILEELFPKDKYIFLMCGGGGYAGMMKQMLVALGWDENKIYNVGGYWYYEGNHKVETTYEEDGVTKYDFSKIVYHDIDFNSLTKLRDSGSTNTRTTEGLEVPFSKILSVQDLNELIDTGNTFAVFVYLPSCSSCAQFLTIVEEFVDANDLEMFAVSLRDIWYEENVIKDRVSYTPSMFIFSNKEVVAYLNPVSDEDKQYYETLEGLSGWFGQYIDVNELKSETKIEIDDCGTGCKIGD